MKNDTSPGKRFLRFESLESRALLAADVLLHNFAMPEDCDHSGSVSPLDALVVINELNGPDANLGIDAARMLDVDADGLLSPLDALVVINYLNQKQVDGVINPSSVPLSARIARLELAIDNHQLPTDLDVNDAVELLHTMKNGGRPEIGERFIDGRVHSRVEVEQIETEHIASELCPIVADGEHAHRANELLMRFSARLQSAGVNAEVINTITGEIKTGIEAKTPLSVEQIKTRLTELGVDVSKLFPPRHETPPKPETPPHVEPRIEALIQHLKSAGVTADVVTTIATEYKASIKAGVPLTLEQIRTRLSELGVDVAKLFPVAPPVPQPNTEPRWTPSVELVTGILRRANARSETIEKVRSAMITAKESGSPLNPSQVLALLRESGIQIPDAMDRCLYHEAQALTARRLRKRDHHCHHRGAHDVEPAAGQGAPARGRQTDARAVARHRVACHTWSDGRWCVGGWHWIRR